MSNPEPVNQDQKRLDELAKSIWTPEELEEARRKWDELDLAMEFSSAVDRKEAVRRFLDDQLDAATKGPFKGVSGEFPEEVTGDFIASGTKEDKVLVKLDELIRMLPAKTAEGVRQVAAERKEVAATQFRPRNKIVERVLTMHKFTGREAGGRQKAFLKRVNRFLDSAPLDHRLWDRVTAQSFMNEIENDKEGWSEGTQVHFYQAMKACFDAVDQKLPKEVKRPQVHQSKQFRPAIDIERAKTMIRGAKDGKLNNQEAAYVAVWSTYGLRRMEIAQVLKKHLMYEEHKIHLMPEKGQKAADTLERDAYLPDEIIPTLKKYDFPEIEDEIPKENRMDQIYRKIEKKLKLPHIHRMAWHAMRRTLNTYLIYQIGSDKTAVFMRWAKGKEMTDVYNRLGLVSGMFTPIDIDKEALEEGHHPFIAEWRS